VRVALLGNSKYCYQKGRLHLAMRIPLSIGMKEWKGYLDGIYK
jgi:hypothetical protein